MKLKNGNNIMHGNTFNTVVKNIKGRFDLYQNASEYAVFHFCQHGDKQKLEQLLQSFIGVSGKVIGDGRLLAAYVNAMTYGFKVEADGSVKIENKKNGKPKPRGFKGYNEQGALSWKAGGHDHGMAQSFSAWQKAQAEAKQAKRAEAEAKAEAAEAAEAEAKAAKAEAKAAEAEAEADNTTPDYSRATSLAATLRTMLADFVAGQSFDIEALAEAKAEADKLSDAITARMAEAAEAEAATLPEAAEAEAAEVAEA